METQGFENVKDQAGYCGIWCGSCVVGNGTLKKLTKRYEDLVRAYGLDHWGPEGLDFDRFTEGLRLIKGISLCPGCRKGGGRDNCELRACALRKGKDSCNLCPAAEDCKHQEDLHRMRSGAQQAGLFVNTEEGDGKHMIEQWTAELRARWPSCILFTCDH